MKKHFDLILSQNYALADDWISHLLLRSTRKRAIHMLRLQPMERLLIVGVGTGKVIPLLPHGLWITGIDSSVEKLQKAREQTKGHYVTLEKMDPLSLTYEDCSFNAVIFNPILHNETDYAKALREAWRVVRPGGQLIAWECLLKDRGWPSRVCQLFRCFTIGSQVFSSKGLGHIIEGLHDMKLDRSESAMGNGICRIILIRKENLK